MVVRIGMCIPFVCRVEVFDKCSVSFFARTFGVPKRDGMCSMDWEGKCLEGVC